MDKRERNSANTHNIQDGDDNGLVIIANTVATGDHLTSKRSMCDSDQKNCGALQSLNHLLGLFLFNFEYFEVVKKTVENGRNLAPYHFTSFFPLQLPRFD